MERLVRLATDRIVDHVTSLPAQPAADTAGAEALARELIEREPPETGAPAEELLDLLFTRAIPKSFNTRRARLSRLHPRRRALLTPAVADLVADGSQPLRRRLRGRPGARPARERTSSAGSRASSASRRPPAASSRAAARSRTSRPSSRRAATGSRRTSSRGVLYVVRPGAPLASRKAAAPRGLPRRSVREIPVGRDASGSGSTRSNSGRRRPRARASTPFLVVGERRNDEHRRRRRSRRASRTSARGRGSGSTSTRPTAASSC